MEAVSRGVPRPSQKAGLEVPIQSGPWGPVPGFAMGHCLAIFPKEHMEPAKNVLWPLSDPNPEDRRWGPQYRLLEIFITTTSWRLFPGSEPNPDRWEDWKPEDSTLGTPEPAEASSAGVTQAEEGFPTELQHGGLNLLKLECSALARVR